jgi:hypothetical protein
VNPRHKDPEKPLSATFRRDEELSCLPYLTCKPALKFLRDIGGMVSARVFAEGNIKLRHCDGKWYRL